MNSIYETEDRRSFRDTVRRFVATEITPYVDQWDEASTQYATHLPAPRFSSSAAVTSARAMSAILRL